MMSPENAPDAHILPRDKGVQTQTQNGVLNPPDAPETGAKEILSTTADVQELQPNLNAEKLPLWKEVLLSCSWVFSFVVPFILVFFLDVFTGETMGANSAVNTFFIATTIIIAIFTGIVVYYLSSRKFMNRKRRALNILGYIGAIVTFVGLSAFAIFDMFLLLAAYG